MSDMKSKLGLTPDQTRAVTASTRKIAAPPA